MLAIILREETTLVVKKLFLNVLPDDHILQINSAQILQVQTNRHAQIFGETYVLLVASGGTSKAPGVGLCPLPSPVIFQLNQVLLRFFQFIPGAIPRTIEP